ncbi:hypothetical protein AB0A77_02195 [Streptomyces varsoviensis]|uniref:hypothetical protein n=1 Tax=Streptomyces varsoviensis TaxID=67373 RepID=UPI0033F2DCBD
MTEAAGAHVEIVEADHEPGMGVVPTSVRVNGVHVGRLAKTPKVDTGDGRERMTTVTLVLLPSYLEIKGDDSPAVRNAIGFSA